MTTFKIGDWITCIDNSGIKDELIEDQIYQIRWLGHFVDHYTGQNNLCVRLFGIHRFDTMDTPFRANRFISAYKTYDPEQSGDADDDI